MPRFIRKLALLVTSAALTATAFAASTSTSSGRPEDEGLSTQRLKRVAELVQRHLDAGSFSGAVTLVARNGRVVWHEAQGVMDVEAKKPMTKDAMFRIMSMTKPVVGVATMMMIEEGRVHLGDPIAKFIPEWANMTVAVAQPNSGAGNGPPAAPGANAEPRFYTVPASNTALGHIILENAR